jgi:hypothetical protein
MADEHLKILETLRTKHPEYRGTVQDGKLLAALLHKHPEYAKAVGPQGVRLALETGHKPNGTD